MLRYAAKKLQNEATILGAGKRFAAGRFQFVQDILDWVFANEGVTKER